jgi:hypothetical protein
MPRAWTIQNAIWILNFVGTALVIWRLYRLGLHTTYRYFFAGFCLAAVRTLALLPFPSTGEIYFQMWVATQPLLWISWLLIVLELYSLVLQRYPGIRTAGRWFSLAAVGVALSIALAMVLPIVSRGLVTSGRPKLMYYYVFLERGLTGGLGILLLLLLGGMALFAVPASRNLRTHCAVYTAYFFAQNVILLYWHLAGRPQGQTAAVTSIARLTAALICYCCWAALLTKGGEKGMAPLGFARSPEYERRVLGQLERLNETILHAAKK